MLADQTINAVLQYGSFALLALLVGWALKIGIPKALDMHQNAMKEMLATFQNEAKECRDERQEVSKLASEEREKDRKARHDLADKFQELVLLVSNMAKGPPAASPPPLAPEQGQGEGHGNNNNPRSKK